MSVPLRATAAPAPARWIYDGAPSGPDGQGGTAQVLAVHAALLPGGGGRILYFSGSQWIEPTIWESIENEPDVERDPQFIAGKAQIDHTRVYDCATGQITNPGSPDTNTFCAGHAFTADGRLLVADGTQHFPPPGQQADLHHAHFGGARQTWLFDPRGEAPWVPGPLLNRDPEQADSGQPAGGGRWYPTLVTLPSGAVCAMCGHPLNGEFSGNPADFDIRHNNTKPEIYDPAANAWQLVGKELGVSQAHDYTPYYPQVFVVPGTGELFIVQPLYSRLVVPPQGGPDPNLWSANESDTNPPYGIDPKDNSIFYDVDARAITRSFAGPQALDSRYVDHLNSQETTAVMLPLLHQDGYHPRILLCGAPQPLIADLGQDDSAPPGWRPTAVRQLRESTGDPVVRNYANATLLPTGDVLVSGGVTKVVYTQADGVQPAEIYHPPRGGQADSWETGPIASETRGYHSVALLMPDGRVWTAGSQWNHTATPNLAIELFEPAYNLVSGRVSITASPSALTYGEVFAVEFQAATPDTTISRVALLRSGSVTHAFNGDQRYVSVPFTQTGARLDVTAPPDATVAPPGYYMLWLLDGDDMPCRMAWFVWIRAQG